MSLSFSLFRAITSSWAFLRLEEDSSSRAMFASFSLMAASSACCLREGQQTETSGQKWNRLRNGKQTDAQMDPRSFAQKWAKLTSFTATKGGRWTHTGGPLTSAVARVHMQMSH